MDWRSWSYANGIDDEFVGCQDDDEDNDWYNDIDEVISWVVPVIEWFLSWFLLLKVWHSVSIVASSSCNDDRRVRMRSVSACWICCWSYCIKSTVDANVNNDTRGSVDADDMVDDEDWLKIPESDDDKTEDEHNNVLSIPVSVCVDGWFQYCAHFLVKSFVAFEVSIFDSDADSGQLSTTVDVEIWNSSLYWCHLPWHLAHHLFCCCDDWSVYYERERRR